MFRYILLVLILFILLVNLRLLAAVQSLHSGFFDYCSAIISSNHSKMSGANKYLIQPQISISNIYTFEKRKRNIRESFLYWLATKTVEATSWRFYKKTFISDDGRVIDPLRGSVTTSEGQSYAMRRAIMLGDKVTFDKTYDWTKYNLQHKNDKLFAWLWGRKSPVQQKEIEYGIIDQNDASDASGEIAASLIFAYRAWGQASYMNDALNILKDIWNQETIEIKGERILVAGINQKKLENVEVNPSYFMPYAFRIFAKVDKEHDWQKLVDSSYRLTNWCIDHVASGLPPDIFYINRDTGVIAFDKNKSDFSYDAVRIFYRFYIDYNITGEPRAKKLLSRCNLFIDRWNSEHKFYTCYKQNGELKNYDEAIGSIALLIPVIKMYDNKVADKIYKNRIKAKYNRKGYWNNPMDYYAQNLVWFGNWLYKNEENIRSFKY